MRGNVGIALIVEKILENQLGHILRREEAESLRLVKRMHVEEIVNIGTQIMLLLRIKLISISREGAVDRVEYRTMVDKPKYLEQKVKDEMKI